MAARTDRAPGRARGTRGRRGGRCGLVTLALVVFLGPACGPPPAPRAPVPAPAAEAPPVVASMDPAPPRPGPALRQVLAELGGPDDELAALAGAALTGDPAAADVLARALGDERSCEAAALAVGLLPRPLARRPLWLALRADCGAAAALVASELLGEHALAAAAVRSGEVSCDGLARAVRTGLAPRFAGALEARSEAGDCPASSHQAVLEALAVAGRGAAAVRLARSMRDEPGLELGRTLSLAFSSRDRGGELEAFAAETLASPPASPEAAWAAAVAARRPGEALLGAAARLAARASEPACAADEPAGATEQARCRAARAALVQLARRPGSSPSVPGLEALGFGLPETEGDLGDPRVAAAALRLRRGDPVVGLALELGLGGAEPAAPAARFVRLYGLGGSAERLASYARVGDGELCAALVEAGRLEAAAPALVEPAAVPRCLLPAALALAPEPGEAATSLLRAIASVPARPGPLLAAGALLRRDLSPPRWSRDPASLGRALAAALAPLAPGAAEAPSEAEVDLRLARRLRAAALELLGAADRAPAESPPTLLLRDLRAVLPVSSGPARLAVARLAFAEAPSHVVLERLETDPDSPALEAAVLASPALRAAVLRRGRPAALAALALSAPDQEPEAGVPLLRGEGAELAQAWLVARCGRGCVEPLAGLAAEQAAPPAARARAAAVLSSLRAEVRLGALAGAGSPAAVGFEAELARWLGAGLEGPGPEGDDPRLRALEALGQGAGARAVLAELGFEAAAGAGRRPGDRSLLERLSGCGPARQGGPARAVVAEPEPARAFAIAWSLRALGRLAAEGSPELAEAAADALAAAVELLPDGPARPEAVAEDLRAAARRGPEAAGARAGAARGLASFGRAEDLALVVELASDPSPAVRASALGALGRARTARAAEAVALAASDPDRAVRVAAAEAALELGALPVAAAIGARDLGASFRRVAEEAPAWALAAVDSAAGSADETDRLAALEVVCRTGSGLRSLSSLLGDPAPRVRAAAARVAGELEARRPVDLGPAAALGELEPGQAGRLEVPPRPAPRPRLAGQLAPLLADRQAEVRLQAAAALARASESPASALVPLLADPEPEVRALALGGLLAAPPGAEGLQALAAALAAGPGRPTRRALLVAILAAGEADGLEQVARALGRGPSRDDALVALGLVGPGRPDRARQLAPALGRAAVAALRAGGPGAVAARGAAASWLVEPGVLLEAGSGPARALLEDLRDRPGEWAGSPALVEALLAAELAPAGLGALRDQAVAALRGP